VSHEFRTPLASLRHVAELLDENDELPGDRRRALYGVISRNATRLGGLVDTLLDFTRFESGRRPYAFRSIDAGALVASVVEDFTREIDDGQVHVSSLVATGDLSMDADAEALTRALWNLLDNAAKYGPRPCHIEVSVMRTADQIEFAVRDDGPGIPAREQQNVFEKFVRGEDAARRGIRGTGLGLAIVSHVAQAHGGGVKVESEPGGGTTFRIVLPVAAASSSSPVHGQGARHAATDGAPAEADSWRES
jgi:two-component system phosphate regulon sensor histidine kinase PhoR